MLFPRLVGLYESHGYQVLSSVAPMLWVQLATHEGRSLVDHPNDRLFTYILKDARFCSNGGGLHMTELYLLECLAEVFDPRRIFVIGNAFGWSTLALSLAFPQARVVAIDSGGVFGGKLGIDFVNRAATAEGLNTEAVEATSPQDVSLVVDRHLGGGIDLALIDGDHNNSQQSADFRACQAAAAPGCVYLLHDVINWNMGESLDAIARENSETLQVDLLTRTASGMAAIYPKAETGTLAPVFRSFVDPFAFSYFGEAQPS